jgi:hypothetical protein
VFPRALGNLRGGAIERRSLSLVDRVTASLGESLCVKIIPLPGIAVPTPFLLTGLHTTTG